MKYLLDTCIISELVVKKPNPKVVTWVDSLDSEDIYLSVLTIGEITKGIEKLPKSKRKQELRDWLLQDLLSRFNGKILPLDTDIIVEWGVMMARLENVGRKMPAIDSLIAATALSSDCVLATRNVSDFEAAGIKIINPWE